MRLAVILKNINLSALNSSLREVLLFDADQDVIVAIGGESIPIHNINYFCLWLLAKKVKRIYCDEIVQSGKNFLKKAGIDTQPLEKIRDNPILAALLIKKSE